MNKELIKLHGVRSETPKIAVIFSSEALVPTYNIVTR
jgi:hypothetical protein